MNILRRRRVDYPSLSTDLWGDDALEEYISMLNSVINPHIVTYPPDSTIGRYGKDFETLCEKLGEDVGSRIAYDYPPLHEHSCQRTDCSCVLMEPKGLLQKNGQLMGSPLSFPYLCIINLAFSWDAAFPYIKDHRQVPIKVNGDDIIFRVSPEVYGHWCDAAFNAGFLLSVGKNFAHARFLYINSQPWQCIDRGDGKKEFRYVRFFNQGLMNGQSKVGKVSGEPFSDIMKPTYALQVEAVDGASNYDQAIKEFHHRHKDHLNEVSCDGFFGYTVPTEYYGLGMRGLPTTVVTRIQRRLAPYAQRDKLACKVMKRLECDDEQFSPIFTQPKQGGEEILNYSTVSKSTVSEHPPRFLTPYIKVMPEQCQLDDVEYEKRICTSRCIRKELLKRLKSEHTRAVTSHALFRGFVTNLHALIPVKRCKLTDTLQSTNTRAEIATWHILDTRCTIPFKQRNFSIRFDTRREPVPVPVVHRNRPRPLRNLELYPMDHDEEMAADFEDAALHGDDDYADHDIANRGFVPTEEDQQLAVDEFFRRAEERADAWRDDFP